MSHWRRLILATEDTEDTEPPHTPLNLGFPTPPQGNDQPKGRVQGGGGENQDERLGRGSVSSVCSVANKSQTVEVSNVPINDRTTKHKRDRCRGGEKHAERHQTIFLADVERYEYQGAE